MTKLELDQIYNAINYLASSSPLFSCYFYERKKYIGLKLTSIIKKKQFARQGGNCKTKNLALDMFKGIVLELDGGRFRVFPGVQPSRFLRRFLHFSPVKLVYVCELVTFSAETQSYNHAMHAKNNFIRNA